MDQMIGKQDEHLDEVRNMSRKFDKGTGERYRRIEERYGRGKSRSERKKGII